MSTAGTKNYNGIDWFWPHDFRHYLRDANTRQRKLIHNGWLKIGVPVKKSGLKISDRYLEPKKSQEKKAWTIVKKVIAPKELESVNEEAYYDSDNKIKTSIDNSFKKAGIKVVKFKPMKKSFYKGLWGGFYYVKSVRGTDTIPVYVEKKGFIDLGVSEKDFWIGKVGSSEVARNLKDFKKTDLDTDLDESVNEAGLEINKLKDAIKMFQKKIKKQGRVTNARDEEHLKNLIKVYKQMGGKGVKEAVIKVSKKDDVPGNPMKMKGEEKIKKLAWSGSVGMKKPGSYEIKGNKLNVNNIRPRDKGFFVRHFTMGTGFRKANLYYDGVHWQGKKKF